MGDTDKTVKLKGSDYSKSLPFFHVCIVGIQREISRIKQNVSNLQVIGHV